jgi:hypothetical protein
VYREHVYLYIGVKSDASVGRSVGLGRSVSVGRSVAAIRDLARARRREKIDD